MKTINRNVSKRASRPATHRAPRPKCPPPFVPLARPVSGFKFVAAGTHGPPPFGMVSTGRRAVWAVSLAANVWGAWEMPAGSLDRVADYTNGGDRSNDARTVAILAALCQRDGEPLTAPAARALFPDFCAGVYAPETCPEKGFTL